MSKVVSSAAFRKAITAKSIGAGLARCDGFSVILTQNTDIPSFMLWEACFYFTDVDLLHNKFSSYNVVRSL